MFGTTPDRTEESGCDCSPSGALLRAYGEFNRGEWFDCHETLEELWLGTEGEMRAFYQGLLQIAVALHHWRNGNFKGALFLLERGSIYLQQVRPVCQRIEAARMADEAGRFYEALVELGPERMRDVSPSLVPRMRLAPATD